MYHKKRKDGAAVLKGSEEMQDTATQAEYILRLVLELIAKCDTLEELREAVARVLAEAE